MPYFTGEEAPSITEWGKTILVACNSTGITGRATAEPGRAIVAQAAVTLYRVGAIKDIPDVRTSPSTEA